jgi:hypothetical protein
VNRSAFKFIWPVASANVLALPINVGTGGTMNIYELKPAQDAGVEPLEIDTPEFSIQPFPFEPAATGEDWTAFMNARAWLQRAVEAQGAKMVGGGCGFGGADIDIELEGCRFNIFIRPI